MVTTADISDSAGAQLIFDSHRKRWPWVKHLFADGAYDRLKLMDKAAYLGFVIELIRRSDDCRRSVAAHVGTPPGARIVESDRLHKSMHGVTPETRLPDEAYRPEISQRVYCEMGRQAGLTLAGGGSVIANAVFDRAADRERIEHVARRSALPFQGFWLEAAPDLLRKRVEQRKQGQCTSVPPTKIGRAHV